MGLYAKLFDVLLTSQRSNGVTLAGGKVAFFVPGTVALKAVYLDRAKQIPAENPFTLSGNGIGEVFLDGLYDISVKNAKDVEQYFWASVLVTDGFTTYVTMDATAGNDTLILSESVEDYTITRLDATANTCIISPPVGYTIMGSATYALTVQNEAVRLVLDGTIYTSV